MSVGGTSRVKDLVSVSLVRAFAVAGPVALRNVSVDTRAAQ